MKASVDIDDDWWKRSHTELVSHAAYFEKEGRQKILTAFCKMDFDVHVESVRCVAIYCRN